jgi:hypothetical protein
MFESSGHNNIVVEFREYHSRQQNRNSILELALNKCEETFMRSDWSGFGYWFAIYRRERMRRLSKGATCQ